MKLPPLKHCVFSNQPYASILALALLCFSLPAFAVAEGQPLAATPLPLEEEPSNSRLSYSQTLTDYQAAIEEIEAQHGPWGTGLSEQLAGLGRTYQSRGQHLEAINIFERAAHVDRINQGLYSISQAPIIESQIESMIARGLWDDVHDRHRYLYWLHQRSYGDDDPRMLPVIDKLGKWYINDYAMNPTKRQPEVLIDAHVLFTDATKIISKEYGENDLRLVEPLRGLALSNWYFAAYSASVANQVDSGRYNNQLGTEFNNDQADYLVRNNFGTSRTATYYSDSEMPNRLLRYIRTSYIDGKDSIDRMIQIYQNNPEAPPGAAAAAKVELADWQLLWDKYYSAKIIYREAYESLAKDEKTKAKANKLFARPVALPAMSLLETELGESAERVQGDAAGDEGRTPAELMNYVLVQYDVDQFGSAKNINILEKHPENGPNSLHVRRSLQSTRFRPKLLDGEPVTATGIVQKFIFPGQP